MRLGIAMVVAAAASLASSVGLAQGGPPPAKVRLDGVRLQTVEQMRRVTGELRALRRSELATQAEGRVVFVGVREGEPVEASQVIARLDSEEADLQLARQRAELFALEATVQERSALAERAGKELERVRSLREAASASAQELDDAMLEDAAARARLARAEADVETAARSVALLEKRVRDMEVRAPFAGRVTGLMTEVGQWVGVGDAVIEMYEAESIEAWIDVPERYVGRVASAGRDGLPVRVIIEAADSVVEGEIIQIVPSADTLSRLFPVRIGVPSDGVFVRPGMSVVAEVPTGESIDALTVHKDAILQDDAGEFVYAALPAEFGEGLAGMPVRISRLFAVGDRVAVRPGRLSDGMRVVIEGNERMFPTQPLLVQGGGDDSGPTPQANAGDERGEG
ncbi:MAG: efflux RND transporter periplasmic adaptor subunit [Planctomycetota bacterium]